MKPNICVLGVQHGPRGSGPSRPGGESVCRPDRARVLVAEDDRRPGQGTEDKREGFELCAFGSFGTSPVGGGNGGTLPRPETKGLL